ncbi:MAG: NnrU family protein, partial [Chloroflexota bacterium]
MRSMLTFLLVFATWAVVHSILASSRFKDWMRQRMGDRLYDGTYRLTYNVLAAITFLPVLLVGAAALPHQILWDIDGPVRYLFLALQIVGVAGLTISLLQTDVMRFVGLGQLFRYLRGDSEINPSPTLITTGTYRLVRHP